MTIGRCLANVNVGVQRLLVGHCSTKTRAATGPPAPHCGMKVGCAPRSSNTSTRHRSRSSCRASLGQSSETRQSADPTRQAVDA
jgi:hypothetical protein